LLLVVGRADLLVLLPNRHSYLHLNHLQVHLPNHHLLLLLKVNLWMVEHYLHLNHLQHLLMVKMQALVVLLTLHLQVVQMSLLPLLHQLPKLNLL
jgi:hypothetical protein